MSALGHIGVIGGGPAGLRAAEVAAQAGARVTVYDARPSPGRKFLVAGKSGLNLTNDTPPAEFAAQYAGTEMPADFWAHCLAEFGGAELRAWAAGLGIETFAASSGKVFPVMKKAAPLLRRWISRLRSLGVCFAMNHRWTDLRPPDVFFEVQPYRAHDALVLATGGASWPQTGSDGAWAVILARLGVAITPLRSANCGWECAWTPETRARVEGRPLHNLRVCANGTQCEGELLLTRYGIEGTAIYQLGRALRAMKQPELRVDFKPTLSAQQLVAKMDTVQRDFLREAQTRWRLPDAACAIIAHLHGAPATAAQLAALVKDCRIPLLGPRPLAEAISTAGGVAWSELDERLMLRKAPGIFCAGEMLDWEAPTGGYLLQGCFATGTLAGRAAVEWARSAR